MKRLAVLLVGAFVMMLAVAGNVAAAGGRDCDSNAMIYCGAYTKTELLGKLVHGDTLHSAASLQALYNAKGMTTTTINQTVDGVAYKNGEVRVNGKIVATGAKSDGRLPITGAVRDGSLWQTTNQQAFLSNSIDAFVYLRNGQFQWAILKSCGNTVVAKAVVVITPTPTPTPTPTLTPTPTPLPTPTPTPTPLPQTGTSAPVAGALGLTGIGTAMRSYVTSRRALKAELKRSVDK